MGRFTTRNLRVIDRLFSFAAGDAAAPTLYDSVAPIQPVHDIGRMAELNSVETSPLTGGLASPNSLTNTHGAADAQQSVLDPYFFTTPWMSSDVWVWLMDAVLNSTADQLAMAHLSVTWPTITAAIVSGVNPIISWSELMNVGTGLAGTQWVGAEDPSTGLGLARHTTLPMLLPRNCSISFRSISTGVAVMNAYPILWVGKVGTYPPGVA